MIGHIYLKASRTVLFLHPWRASPTIHLHRHVSCNSSGTILLMKLLTDTWRMSSFQLKFPA